MGILKALHDVAAGMEYVAGKDIIHRDLDMVNILVTSNKTCKIGDFGWARYVGHCPNREYRETVSCVGYATCNDALTDKSVSASVV